jgi:hypothetical protein
MSLMRLIASWLESTSQRPSDARIMISSCVVSISSRTSGVATCTPQPFLQSPSIHFTHVLVGYYLVISKHFLSSLSIVSIPIHVFAPIQVVQHPNNEFQGGTTGSDFQESSAKTIGNDQKEGHSQPPEVVRGASHVKEKVLHQVDTWELLNTCNKSLMLISEKDRY